MRQFLFVMEPNTQESGKLFKDTLYIRALGRNFCIKRPEPDSKMTLEIVQTLVISGSLYGGIIYLKVAQSKELDHRFEAVDRQFASMEKTIHVRFETVKAGFETVTARFDLIF